MENYIEEILRYITGEMTKQEQSAFDQKLDKNSSFRDIYFKVQGLRNVLNDEGVKKSNILQQLNLHKQLIKEGFFDQDFDLEKIDLGLLEQESSDINELNIIETHLPNNFEDFLEVSIKSINSEKPKSNSKKTIYSLINYKKWISVAAGIAILIVAGYYFSSFEKQKEHEVAMLIQKELEILEKPAEPQFFNPYISVIDNLKKEKYQVAILEINQYLEDYGNEELKQDREIQGLLYLLIAAHIQIGEQQTAQLQLLDLKSRVTDSILLVRIDELEKILSKDLN